MGEIVPMKTVPLSLLKPGDSAVVVNVYGCPRLRSKLYSIGIAPGVVVKVVEKYSRGPVILEVNGARIAVGSNMASKIFVKQTFRVS